MCITYRHWNANIFYYLFLAFIISSPKADHKLCEECVTVPSLVLLHRTLNNASTPAGPGLGALAFREARGQQGRPRVPLPLTRTVLSGLTLTATLGGRQRFPHLSDEEAGAQRG